jgi:hypothetical protein
MAITFPDTVTIIDDIRSAIGRDIIFVQATLSGCTYSGCSLDPIANSSINSYCPACSGLYWIPIYSTVTISGHVTWAPSDYNNWQTGGQQIDGDCRVQIKYTPANVVVVESSKWVEVDGKKLQVRKKMLRGVKQLNRILIDLIEVEKEV